MSGFVHADNSASFGGIGRGDRLAADESALGRHLHASPAPTGSVRIQQFGMPNVFYMTALPTDPGDRLAGIAVLVGPDR